jgi:hypothetical protein
MNVTVDAMAEICRIVAAVIVVRTLPPARLGAIVAALRDNGGDTLANVLVGTLPFDAQPSIGTMERLTHE